MKRLYKISAGLISGLMIGAALFSAAIPTVSAQDFGLIVCGVDQNGNKVLDKNEQCGFYHLMTLAVNLMRALVYISTFLATGVFAYAGIKLITSQGNPGARDYAKDVLWKVVVGYLGILGAWLIVYTITKVLLNDGYTLLNVP